MTLPDRANATAHRFAERYELHEELGRGGMAVVYRATDCGTGRTVALKQLVDRRPGERDAQVALLFQREFQTLAQLKHPSVIDVYDYGVTADGECYYTMELLDGASLRDRVPVPWREACRLAFDVCSALALLHSRRLIHRDVSPRNVSWTASGAAKLIDFGAVAPMSAGEGTIVGTPAFTAPEMVNRSALDGRTDLYSLGATLYYALTGQLAYFARNFSELNDSWKHPPRPPSVSKPEIPAALDDLLLSLLDVEPARRQIERVEQGDWSGAEKLQRSAELLALRTNVPPMFTSTFTVEISAHALARDLAGVQEVIERERAEAARFPGWIPYVREAEARFDLIRGDWTTARAKFESLIADTAPDAALRSPCMAVWLAAQGGLCETLLALDLPDVARATAHAALAVCDKLEIRTFASEVKRLLALAEAKLGDVPGAVARLDALIAEHNALGASGLRMGIVYEARAEVALLANDRSAFETFARLTAREYRHGAGCPLSARYERLMNEARRRGLQVGLTLGAEAPALSETGLGDLRSVVRLALSDVQGPSERYTRALRLVCDARAARGAHFYLPTDEGPRLMMTHGLTSPSPQLANAVQDMLADQEDRFETRTVAVHGIPQLSASAPVTRVEGTDYELLLLVHRTSSEAEISGVIALAPNQPDKPNPSQAQLIALIAEQLSAA